MLKTKTVLANTFCFELKNDFICYTINDLNENNSIVMGFNVPNIQNIKLLNSEDK